VSRVYTKRGDDDDNDDTVKVTTWNARACTSDLWILEKKKWSEKKRRYKKEEI